ncbi:MAG: hypothetical protein U1F43_29130 [Myxococcota bacterium]
MGGAPAAQVSQIRPVVDAGCRDQRAAFFSRCRKRACGRAVRRRSRLRQRAPRRAAWSAAEAMQVERVAQRRQAARLARCDDLGDAPIAASSSTLAVALAGAGVMSSSWPRRAARRRWRPRRCGDARVGEEQARHAEVALRRRGWSAMSQMAQSPSLQKTLVASDSAARDGGGVDGGLNQRAHGVERRGHVGELRAHDRLRAEQAPELAPHLEVSRRQVERGLGRAAAAGGHGRAPPGEHVPELVRTLARRTDEAIERDVDAVESERRRRRAGAARVSPGPTRRPASPRSSTMSARPAAESPKPSVATASV